jgi:hypothetical protein
MDSNAEPFRLKPDAEQIRAAIASDTIIHRLLERHEQAETTRTAAVRSSIETASTELAEHRKEWQRLKRTICQKQKALRALKRQARKHKLPARLQRQINRRKESIRARECGKFLRQWKIQFDRETRNI